MVNNQSAGSGALRSGIPKRRSQAIGRYGEDVAARYLEDKGYAVVQRNWRGESGEIDLVAIDADALVICEVKTRTTAGFGDPALAVTAQKLARLRLLAGEWLAEHRLDVGIIRIDVVAVRLAGKGAPEVNHILDVS